MPETQEYTTLSNMIISYSWLKTAYQETLRANAYIFVQCWADDSRQDFTDNVLNSSPFFDAKNLPMFPFVFDGPVEIPDHIHELDKTWPQIVHAICRATMERDLNKAIDYQKALSMEEKTPTPDKEDILMDAGWVKQEGFWMSPDVCDSAAYSFEQAWEMLK